MHLITIENLINYHASFFKPSIISYQFMLHTVNHHTTFNSTSPSLNAFVTFNYAFNTYLIKDLTMHHYDEFQAVGNHLIHPL